VEAAVGGAAGSGGGGGGGGGGDFIGLFQDDVGLVEVARIDVGVGGVGVVAVLGGGGGHGAGLQFRRRFLAPHQPIRFGQTAADAGLAVGVDVDLAQAALEALARVPFVSFHFVVIHLFSLKRKTNKNPNGGGKTTPERSFNKEFSVKML